MIADATGQPDISKASISRVENLETGYTQDFLEACADALGTHPGVLLMRRPTAADAAAVESTLRPRARSTKSRRKPHPSERVQIVHRSRRASNGPSRGRY